MAEINLGRVKGDKGDTGADGLTTSVKLGDVSYSHVDGTISLPAYPSKTSELVNDAGFITAYGHNHDDRYYTEAETDIKIATAKTEAIAETQTWAKGTFSNPPLNINGGFDIWQRGTIFTNVAAVYTADRWLNSYANSNISQQANTSPAPCTYSLLLAKRSDLSGYIRITQPLENYSLFSGQTMTLSLYARGTGGYTGMLQAHIGSTYKEVALNSEWQKIEYTTNSATFGTSSHQKGVALYGYTTAIGQGIELAGVKLELSSVATPFVPRPYGEELALCQRYYQIRSVNTIGDVDLRPSMRVSPTKSAITGGYAYDAEI